MSKSTEKSTKVQPPFITIKLHFEMRSKEFQFDTREVEIFRRGDEVVLRSRVKTLADVASILSRLSPDFMEDGRDQGPPQVREEL